MMVSSKMDSQQIYTQVQSHYGSVALSTASKYHHTVAKAFGYSEEELSSIPKEANLGVSCGNPLAIAGLRDGETVIDLGSGAGFDAFLAANKVGETGRVIGVDMNKEMLARARTNKSKSSFTNVDFVESQITSISLDSSIADCIISNCVVNLVPEEEKQLVFNEMYRLLKPSGRVAISDILLKKPLTPELKENVGLYVGCISGASMVEGYEKYLKAAGFVDVMIVDTESDLNVYMTTDEDGNVGGACCPPPSTASASKGSCCAPPAPSTAKAEVNKGSCCAPPPTTAKSESSCCGPKETKSCGPKEASSCGAKEKETNGCAPKKEEVSKSIQEFSIPDIDLNEWAGSYKIFAVKS